jgi:hypothetical protein
MERVGISRVFVYIIGFLSFLAGGLTFSFLCREFDLNVWNDADDTHVLEFHSQTTLEVKTQQIQLPSVEKQVIAGKALTDSDRIIFTNHRGLQSHTTGNNGVQSNTKEGLHIAGMAETVVDPCPDMSFKVRDTLRWTYLQNVVTPDTSFLHTQTGADTVSFLVDCMFQKIYDFKLSRSPIDVITIDKTVNNIIVKRPWLRFGPFVGTNALNTSEWFAGATVAIRFGNLWISAAAELPMRKDPEFSIPITGTYDFITLER